MLTKYGRIPFHGYFQANGANDYEYERQCLTKHELHEPKHELHSHTLATTLLTESLIVDNKHGLWTDFGILTYVFLRGALYLNLYWIEIREIFCTSLL